MTRPIKIITPLLFLLLLGQCKESYVSPYTSPTTGYLVVEGYIAGGAPTRFALSRVIALPGDSAIPAERRAKVQVEGNDNSVYALAETDAGVYTADTLPLHPTAQYRLRIQTSNGESYLSDWTPYRSTPAIDSVNWTRDPSGVSIYVNTHDPANATRYYQWEFAETWQYNSAEFSSYAFRSKGGSGGTDTVTARAASEYVYTCYHNQVSTSLLLASSARLAQDVIYRQPLRTIPAGSQQLSILYSLLVRQYALTEDAYNFLTLMKANTESLGSIFDAQPSQLKGNIHCLTHPEEPVVGYVSAGTVREQRLFISAYQVPGWHYVFACELPDKLITPDSIDYYFAGGAWTPLDRIYNGSGFAGWSANGNYCVDCTIQGGTTKKPSFWPL
jgi:hypothetical protein